MDPQVLLLLQRADALEKSHADLQHQFDLLAGTFVKLLFGIMEGGPLSVNLTPMPEAVREAIDAYKEKQQFEALQLVEKYRRAYPELSKVYPNLSIGPQFAPAMHKKVKVVGRAQQMLNPTKKATKGDHP